MPPVPPEAAPNAEILPEEAPEEGEMFLRAAWLAFFGLAVVANFLYFLFCFSFGLFLASVFCLNWVLTADC
jgi:hypothetical protein